MDRLYDLSSHTCFVVGALQTGLLLGALASSACTTEKSDSGSASGAAPSRFQAVTVAPSATSSSATEAAGRFCDKSYPAVGADVRRWHDPPSRPLPEGLSSADGTGAPHPVAKAAGGAAGGHRWTWVNLWATWCQPCMAEMGLMERWNQSLAREGVAVAFELWSVDETEAELRKVVGVRKLPGNVRWLRSMDDLSAMLEGLGVEKSSAIPIHALVDDSGMLRCVRVGTLSEESYGSVKALLQGT